MSLGKRHHSGGEILPILKIDARHGTIYVQTRTLSHGEWVPEQRGIEPSTFVALFDLEGLEICWAHFPKGARPDIIAVPAGQDLPDAPSQDHRQGVRFKLKLSEANGGGIYECLSCAVGVWHAMDDLHGAYLAGLVEHPGQLPIIGIETMVEHKSKLGSNYAPKFKITGWLNRPADLPATAPAATVRKPAPQATAPKLKLAGPDPFNDEIPWR